LLKCPLANPESCPQYSLRPTELEGILCKIASSRKEGARTSLKRGPRIKKIPLEGRKMKKSIYALVAGVYLLFGSLSIAYGGEQSYLPYSGSKEFERLKELVGVWEGTSNMAKEGEKVRVEYRLSSGGSSVVETLFPGKADEMISVYYDDKGQLTMTHYCALRNQPRMKLRNADAQNLYFMFVDGSNIDPLKDAHMHSLTITFVDKDHLIQKWTLFAGGQEKGTSVFELSRIR
jgi:hypothetical protein